MRGHLRGILEDAAERVERGVYAVAIDIYRTSLTLVPRDTGALADSSLVRSLHTGMFTSAGVGPSAEISYGREDYPVQERWSPKEGKMVKRLPAGYAKFVVKIPKQHNPPETHEFLSRPTADIAHLKQVFATGIVPVLASGTTTQGGP